MLESLEGRRGMPRLRPPFPAESGYLGRPTLINNVETLAHIPAILRHGGRGSPGHGENGATVSSCGQSRRRRRPGCYEAPNGIVLRRLLDEFAGGATEEIGAIVPGGAPQACRRRRRSKPAHARGDGRVGIRRRLGRRPGVPQGYPIVRLRGRRCASSPEESCQKCTPCRIGTRGLEFALHELRAGERCSPASSSRNGCTRWSGARSAASARRRRRLRAAMRHWPEAFAALS